MKNTTYIAPLKAALAEFDIFDDAALENLVTLALCVDTQLTRLSLDFLTAAGQPEAREQILGTAGSIEVAFRDVLDELGFPPHVMAEDGPQRHPSVETILIAAVSRAVPEQVASFRQDMREFLSDPQASPTPFVVNSSQESAFDILMKSVRRHMKAGEDATARAQELLADLELHRAELTPEAADALVSEADRQRTLASESIAKGHKLADAALVLVEG